MDKEKFKKGINEDIKNILCVIVVIVVVFSLNGTCDRISGNKDEKTENRVKKIEKTDSIANKIVIEKLNNKAR